MRIVVTGTDTGVGKTEVTRMLAAGARADGRPVGAIKPIASGTPSGAPVDDAVRIALAAGHEPRCFATWPAPVAPHRAQALAGRPLDVPALRSWLDAQPGDPLLVEGAGGWRSPIAGPPGAPIDLEHVARHLGASVLVVAPNRLGVLTQARLVCEAVSRDGLPLLAVVLVDAPSPGDDPSTAYNEEDLRALGLCPVVRAPWLGPDDPPGPAGQALWRALGAS